jgi:hypothetical protein
VIQLQELLRGTPYADKFQDYTDYKECSDTGETFFTPVVRELELLQHSFDERGTQERGKTADVDILDGDELEVQELSQGMSAAMQFSLRQDDEGFGQPICPVMKCEEKKIETSTQNNSRTSSGGLGWQ